MLTHDVTATLTVSQAPDFRIDVSPPSQSVLQGQTASYTVNVVALNGFNSQVSLTVSGLPPDADGVFSVPSGTPNFGSTLTVTLPTNVPIGSFTLTITGTGGGISRVANADLIVNQSTQTQTSSTQTLNTGTSNPSGITDILQQNGLLIVGGIAVILVLAALALRARRKPGAPRTETQARKADTIYCWNCGSQNPATNEFCGKCGTKMR